MLTHQGHYAIRAMKRRGMPFREVSPQAENSWLTVLFLLEHPLGFYVALWEPNNSSHSAVKGGIDACYLR